MKKIGITPIGSIDNDVLDELQQRLEEAFGLVVEVNPQMEQPEYAYDPKRKQYHSTAILGALSGPEERTLGVCDVDLYVPGLNFVFGEADIRRGMAVISLRRLRQEFYGYPEDRRLFTERAVKEAIHELGHTYGLGHCRDARCVMFFSNSLRDTDKKSSLFCYDCHRKLKGVS